VNLLGRIERERGRSAPVYVTLGQIQISQQILDESYLHLERMIMNELEQERERG